MLPFIGTVHADTILTTWLTMLVALLFLAWVGASYRSPRVGKRQTLFEGVINYVADMVYGSLGKGGEPFVPFFIALFIYLFLLNQFGILPFKALGMPFGGSPTADLNTTVPYALMIFFMIQIVAIRKSGFGAYKHLAKPFAILLPINLLEELARPLTLAARLFFNIFVGELLFVIIASIIPKAPILSVLPFFIQFFNFFVGTVQAFVFTLLGIVYLSLATAEDH
jgi:F-type H+-transporting ATPase subunit a